MKRGKETEENEGRYTQTLSAEAVALNWNRERPPFILGIAALTSPGQPMGHWQCACHAGQKSSPGLTSAVSIGQQAKGDTSKLYNEHILHIAYTV